MLRYDSGKSLLFVFVMVSLKCSFAGLSFEVTRRVQDTFQNPTRSECDNLGKDFCLKRDSQCDWGGSRGCCNCACEYGKSTFDTASLKCKKNADFRAGCSLRFKDTYVAQPIKLLDLTKKGKEKLLWLAIGNEKVSSCQITSIVFKHNGAAATTSFLKVDKIKSKKYNPLEIEIKWENNVPIIYHGKVFKVSIRCRTKSAQWTECFVFKSSGKLTVNVNVHPSPSSTAECLSTSSVQLEKSSVLTPSSSFVHVPESSPHITRTISPTSTLPLEPEVVESTPVVTSPPLFITSTVLEPGTGTTLVEPPLVTVETTSLQDNTRETIEKEDQKPTVTIFPTSSTTMTTESSEYIGNPKAAEVSGGKSNNAVVISSSIVGAIILVAAILLFILWSRKKAAKSSQQKERNGGVVNRGATANDDPIAMNHIDNIYAEADYVTNSRCANDNSVYEYAESNANENYTSLDKSLCENKPQYQSLTTVSGNLYEHIPAQSNSNNEQSAVSEPIYHLVEEEEETGVPAPVIYCVLDDQPTQPGNNYDTLDQVTSSKACHEQNEQLYSVLEEDKNETASSSQTPESPYLLVLPENTEYEQPVDHPRS